MMDAPSGLKEVVEAVREWWPGVAGSLTAVGFFLREKAPKLILTFIGGCLAARFLGASVSDIMHSTEAVGGFVTGALSMVILGTIFDVLRAIDTKRIADDMWSFVLKVLRVKK